MGQFEFLIMQDHQTVGIITFRIRDLTLAAWLEAIPVACPLLSLESGYEQDQKNRI